ALADGPHAGRARGARCARIPRLRRVVLRDGFEPRRGRRLVGLVIPEQVENLIGGKRAPARGGEWLEKPRPSDETLLCRVARSRAADVDEAVAAARDVQPAWSE